MKSKIKFVMDSTCDLTSEQIKKYNIEIIPLNIIMGDSLEKDRDFDINKIYAFVTATKTLPQTSAANEFDFKEVFERLTADGSDVLCFTLSSELSATNATATQASKYFDNVFVVDARQLSTGTSLLMMYAADEILKTPDISAKELAEKLNSMGGLIQTSFVVDTIDYLYKGGRCSALALLGANLLKLHPSLHLKDGFITVGKKYRGKMTRIFANYIEDLREENPNYDNTRCFITHTVGTDPELIEEAVAATKKYFDFKEIIITNAGATITCHCGKGTLGLLFMNKE